MALGRKKINPKRREGGEDKIYGRERRDRRRSEWKRAED